MSFGFVRTRRKYSDEHKVGAVNHFLDTGRCISSTIEALGYPWRETLRAWVIEHHPKAVKSIVGRAGSKPRPMDLKRVAVVALCMQDESAQTVAEKRGVCRPTLYNWKNQLYNPGVCASMKRHDESPPVEQEELERLLASLRRDTHQLQLEHDLLKKANEILKKAWTSTCRS